MRPMTSRLLPRILLALAINFCLVVTHASARELPRITILTTGGTIAGAADSRSAIGYNPGQVGARQLIAATPGIAALGQLSSEAVSAVGSQNMTEQIWLTLALRIQELFARNEADAVVITHGTDTLEETAFFLDQILLAGKPVVLVGAMRPSTDLSADGPANLFGAVKVAGSPSAYKRGVLVVMNGVIHAARYVQKTQTTAVDTFRSPNAGPVGYVDAARVRFVTAADTQSHQLFDVPKSAPFPRVDIIYAHAQMDGALIQDAAKHGARGLVLAGMGNGNASKSAIEALAHAASQGVLVIRSTRVGQGFVSRNVEVDDDTLGFIASQDLNPQKARVLTQLLILKGATSRSEVQKAFELPSLSD